jgi:hypothetical protein
MMVSHSNFLIHQHCVPPYLTSWKYPLYHSI